MAAMISVPGAATARAAAAMVSVIVSVVFGLMTLILIAYFLSGHRGAVRLAKDWAACLTNQRSVYNLVFFIACFDIRVQREFRSSPGTETARKRRGWPGFGMNGMHNRRYQCRIQ